ncbi:hypothetical protein HBA54_00020 [Pelagibius litoralis]|uniref:Uncharacterized protein n=1 Tax=Pelagibius litoralis TaxID=374515 RepID=A0A967C5N7_9PROT|nr:hypothetical protein [Pelagibius litoralis]NIA66972.1 hypothetical protein [Pelagibius litoralis]
MPRIPSASDIRSVSAGVTRDPGVRASAEDFGLGVARGISSLSEGIANAAPLFVKLKEMTDKSDAAEEKIQTEKNKAEVRQAAIQMVDDLEYDGNAPLEAAERSAQDLEAMEEEKLRALPPERRAAVREASAPIRLGHGLRAAQRLQNQKVAALEQGTAETLKLLQAQAAADPGAAAKLAADGRGLLTELHAAGALSDAQLEQRSTTFQRELYAGMLRDQPAGDVVADLEAGIYDEALDDSDLKQLLLIESRWRMQGEEAQGRASGRALVASAAQGDAAEPKLSDATARLLAAGDFADFELEAEKARRVRSGVESLRFAPEAEFEGEIGKLAPAVEALDKEARLEIQEAVRKGSEQLLEERRADPADYAMGLPSVAKAFAAAKGDPSLLPAAVSGRLAAQAAMGIGPEDQRALSKAEVAEMLQGYQALPVEARGEAVKALQEAYGDGIGRVAAELEEAGLPAQMVQALDPNSKGASAGPSIDEAQPAASGPGGDIIAETAERLLTEGEEARCAREEADPPEDMSLDRLPRPPFRNPRRDPENLNLLANDDPGGVVGDEGPSQLSESSTGDRGSADQVVAGRPDEGPGVDGLSLTGGPDEAAETGMEEESEESFIDSFSLRAAVRNAPLDPTFDSFRNLPRLSESPKEQAEAIFDTMGLTVYAPEGEDALVLLDIARDLWSLRHRFETQGPSVLTQFEEKVRDFSRVATAKRYHERNPNAKYGSLGVFAKAVLNKPERYLWSLSDNQLDHLHARALDLSDFTEGGEMATSALSTVAPAAGKKFGKLVGVAEAANLAVSLVSGNYAEQLSLTKTEQFRRGILKYPPGSASEKMMIELTGVTPIR